MKPVWIHLLLWPTDTQVIALTQDVFDHERETVIAVLVPVGTSLAWPIGLDDLAEIQNDRLIHVIAVDERVFANAVFDQSTNDLVLGALASNSLACGRCRPAPARRDLWTREIGSRFVASVVWPFTVPALSLLQFLQHTRRIQT